MKYLSLPFHLILFWYLEGARTFFVAWRHAILYLEEDLAVGLMWKLLFVPLFHDSSFIGRILSTSFRLTRIILGLTAFVVTTVLILFLAVFWFLLPVEAVVFEGVLAKISGLLLFSGIVLFIHHIVSHPHKKIRQINKIEEIYKASFVARGKTDLISLLKSNEVNNLLLYLEQKPENFIDFTEYNEVEYLQNVWKIAEDLNVNYLYPQHFFVGLVWTVKDNKKKLLKLGLTLDDFTDALDFLEKKARWWRVVYLWDEDFQVKHLKGVNRGWLGVPTPALDSVGENLTAKAGREYIPDFIGRAEIVSRVVDILSLEKGRNVIIVGEAGSGRTELISFLAKMIVSGNAPTALATKKIVRLDLTSLLSGMTTQGELAERVKMVFNEVQFHGNTVLFIDEIHQLGMGEVGSELNLYSLILPYLESNDFQFISTSDPENFSKVVEKNSSFMRLFTKIDLPPATAKETIDILKNQAINMERYQKVRVSTLAIKEVAQLSDRFIHDQVLPDSALHILEEATVNTVNGWITKEVIEKVVQNRTHLPVGEADSKLKQQLLSLEDIIHQKMIDQEEAVTSVARTLRRAATDLRDPNRPIGSFLFVGPTGVGKTELAKILVEKYFAGKGHFVRLDMSEYQTPDSANKLIGASTKEGQLTEVVRRNPYSLILLDELEKADSRVLTLFLQVLEDGRLTDGSGKTIDFTQTIIIATSNAASLTIAKGIRAGQTVEQLKKVVQEELMKVFKPELLNRFDEVAVFKPLSPDDLEKIVHLKLAFLQKQLQERGFLVDFDSGVVGELVKKGYDPVMGARPLRRLIQDTLEARLSVMMLEGKLPKGEKYLINQSMVLP